MIKKIKDERLQLKNLKNIRILFIVETIGVIGILGYDFITKGMDGMTDNPLWFVLMATGILAGYLNMRIGIDYEASTKSSKKGLIISLIVAVLLSIGVGILFAVTGDIATGLLIGAIFFVCFLAPILYIYYLRSKQEDQ